MMEKTIAIDLVPIRVGEGGTGSGIWTYARELIQHMDQAESHNLEIICLVNAGQIPYLGELKNIRLVLFPVSGKNIVKRLWWVHVRLPLYCLMNRVNVLHKLATETPLWCPSRRVTTVHDFYYEYLVENHPSKTIRLYERLEKFYFAWTTRTCFRKSQAIISVSDATRQEAIKRYPSAAERIHVIHHGAPCSRGQITEDGGRKFEAGQEVRLARSDGSGAATQSPDDFPPLPNNHQPTTNIERKAFNILCVAKFMEHKGQHVLIDAFDALLEQYPEMVGNVRLELRGFHNDADYCRMITERIAASRFSDSMQMTGFDPSGGLEAIYQHADLVVLLSSYEGFGLPVLEAQGMGIPVLCSDLPVLQEVGGEGAVYVGREDRKAIVDAMHRFMTDKDYCEEMRSKALENIGRFSWQMAAKKTLNVY